jgi:RNA polymerase primary sigma factor
MIASNTGLVGFVAHKYKTVSLSFEDLMQEGMVGLIKAVDRFDPERGNCFSTYAIYWIRQAISRLIVKQDKVVPLPVALAEKSSPIFEAMRNTYLQHERWPTLAELKASCDLSEQDIKTISSYYQSTYLQDTSASEDDDGMLMMEKMQQQQFSQPLDDLIDTDLASYMDRAVATLPEKQATILAMRFGLKNHTEMTLQAVADQLQVTRERVRQIQNEALQKLKQQFGFDLMLFLEPNDT